MDQLRKNLAYLMDKRKTNPTAIATATGIPQPTVRRIVLGESEGPRLDKLEALAAFFQVSLNALVYEDLADKNGHRANAPTPWQPRRVPVVGTARMGDDGFYEEVSTVPGAGDGYLVVASTDPDAYGLRVKGQSMFPAIRDGWYVLIEPNGSPAEGEYVLAKLLNGKKMVKEFMYRKTGGVELLSVNGAERISIDTADLEALQPVSDILPPSKWMPG